MKKLSYLLLIGILVTNLAYAKTIKTTGQKTVTFTTDQGSMSIMFPKGSTFTFPDAWVADATICPTCPPPVEIIKEVPVEVIKEVPVEVIKEVLVPAPKYKYTHNSFSFPYVKGKKYLLEISSGVIKVYENDILVVTHSPDNTEQI